MRVTSREQERGRKALAKKQRASGVHQNKRKKIAEKKMYNKVVGRRKALQKKTPTRNNATTQNSKTDDEEEKNTLDKLFELRPMIIIKGIMYKYHMHVYNIYAICRADFFLFARFASPPLQP